MFNDLIAYAYNNFPLSYLINESEEKKCMCKRKKLNFGQFHYKDQYKDI